MEQAMPPCPSEFPQRFGVADPPPRRRAIIGLADPSMGGSYGGEEVVDNEETTTEDSVEGTGP